MSKHERPCALAILILLLGFVACGVFGQVRVKPRKMASAIKVVYYPIGSNTPDTIVALVNVQPDSLIATK